MRRMEKVASLGGSLIAAIVAATLLTATAGAQESVKANLPDSLVKVAKVDEATARQTAQKKVPKGTIEAVELEREKGHLQYSYDVKVPGKSGITEVNVDAMTGKVLGMATESAATEAKEAAEEAKPKQ